MHVIFHHCYFASSLLFHSHSLTLSPRRQHINTIEFIISDSIINTNYNFIIHFIYLYVNERAKFHPDFRWQSYFSLFLFLSSASLLVMLINCIDALLFCSCMYCCWLIVFASGLVFSVSSGDGNYFGFIIGKQN